jgi:ATP-dependent Clp protease ATP-binding subunit ClpB
VEAIATAVQRAQAGLKRPQQPMGSFLLFGPTGVGKTELARSLGTILFKDSNAVIRIDMSEYQERHSVARLFGAPPGYIGHDDGGQLTNAVRSKPYSVVLLDEIEKAHPDVLNTLLQVLDEGHMTDGKGKRADFKNTIIIATSNFGAQVFNDPDMTEDKARAAVLKLAKSNFRPELLNRFDDLVVFNRISSRMAEPILTKLLGETNDLLAKRGIALTLTPKVKSHLIQEGFDPVFGARPLRRTIQRLVENPLSQAILEEKIKSGDHVELGLNKGRITFQPSRAPILPRGAAAELRRQPPRGRKAP